MAQVLIDDHNPFGGPAERHGPLLEGILACGTFRMRQDLLKGTLADVQTRLTFPLWCFDYISCWFPRSTS